MLLRHQIMNWIAVLLIGLFGVALCPKDYPSTDGEKHMFNQFYTEIQAAGDIMAFLAQDNVIGFRTAVYKKYYDPLKKSPDAKHRDAVACALEAAMAKILKDLKDISLDAIAAAASGNFCESGKCSARVAQLAPNPAAVRNGDCPDKIFLDL